MSEMLFICPKCGGSVSGGPEHANIDVQCPHCAELVRLALRPPVARIISAQPSSSPPPPPSTKPCPFCGEAIMVSANKCKHCGEFLDGSARTSAAVAQSPKTSSGAIWSLVLGILSLTFVCSLLSIPAIVCGHKARAKIRKSNGLLQGEGMALAGLITGYIGILFLVFTAPVFFSAINEQANITRSAINARELAAACLKYAGAHGGQLPATLEVVVKEQNLPASLLISPVAKNTSSSGYELLVQGNIADHKNPAQVPFIRDATVSFHGRRNVAFLDGHVEAVNERSNTSPSMARETVSAERKSALNATETRGFTIVALRPSDGDLNTLLKAEVAKAKEKGLKPFVQFYADWCGPCRALRGSLNNPLMQDAFAGTYVVQLDSDAWKGAASAAGFSFTAVPVFFEIGEEGKPTGRQIDGGAWGANTPANMAPPLKEFFRVGK